MESYTFDITQTDYWSEEINSFLNGKYGDQLSSFEPNEDGILKASENRDFSQSSRDILHKALRHQYEKVGIKTEAKVEANLAALKKQNTYTITTGQQLHIGLGPLYVYHKIISVIIAANRLNKISDNYFVPVFWLASEDHDIDEIDHVYVNGTLHRWKKSLSGPVGHLKTEGLEALIDDVIEESGQVGLDPTMWDRFKTIYRQFENFGEATFFAVHQIFESHGLLVIDADSDTLKQHLIPILEKDIEGEVEISIRNQTDKIKKLGIKPQIGAQSFNHFYLSEKRGYRSKIVLENSRYHTEDHAHSWSKEELRKEFRTYPECFSPNVALRPIYQELCLPNVGYLGGPGEMKYWWQLKSVFNLYGIPMPPIPPRIAGIAIPEKYLDIFTQIAIADDQLISSFKIKKRLLSLSNSDSAAEHISNAILSLELAKQALPTKNQHFYDKSAKQIERSLQKINWAEKHTVNELFQSLKSIEKNHKLLLMRYLNFNSPMERHEYIPNVLKSLDEIKELIRSVSSSKTNIINVLTVYFH
jgi:bacillithiol biosynthesis cysteine-adding enzyme BshC